MQLSKTCTAFQNLKIYLAYQLKINNYDLLCHIMNTRSQKRASFQYNTHASIRFLSADQALSKHIYKGKSLVLSMNRLSICHWESLPTESNFHSRLTTSNVMHCHLTVIQFIIIEHIRTFRICIVDTTYGDRVDYFCLAYIRYIEISASSRRSYLSPLSSLLLLLKLLAVI